MIIKSIFRTLNKNIIRNAKLLFVINLWTLFYIFPALQEQDGNFPIALGSENKRNTEKRLVHWCHGAPGAIYFLLRAYRIFNDVKYLDACKKAADLIWEKGLLRKGPGICHGVSGNGYAFLMLYKVTQEPRYLYRAIKFAEFLTKSRFIREANIPDRPFSLYEGVAGTICFLVDLMHIDQADFPFLSI